MTRTGLTIIRPEALCRISVSVPSWRARAWGAVCRFSTTVADAFLLGLAVACWVLALGMLS